MTRTHIKIRNFKLIVYQILVQYILEMNKIIAFKRATNYTMDKYTTVVHNEKFSSLTLKVSNYPKSLIHWENLINYLVDEASPVNKSMDKRLYNLITTTYGSLLFYFPFLENYHIDYAFFEYKLGNVANFHRVFENALTVFNQRSLLLWVTYLKLCNEVVIDNKDLFKKYESAEHYIGLHFFSGEFWELYLEQLQERCVSFERYFIILRKVLEIPTHSFSKFYAIWLRSIDDIQSLSQLKLYAPKRDLEKKLKIQIHYSGRKGPYLFECKKKLKKFTKELYTVVQYQVLEIFSLFESNISRHYFVTADTLGSSKDIETWEKYLDYTINLRINQLTHLTFQRALIPLANYDIVWIKYANWLITSEIDLLTAKNVLLNGLTMSLKKVTIIKLLYSILTKMNDFNTLIGVLDSIENSFSGINNVEEFEIFWDYIQFRIFTTNIKLQSRYSETQSNSLLPNDILDIILGRLKSCKEKSSQEILLNYIIQLQFKENTSIIENAIFKRIVNENWKYYLENDTFWLFYCKLIYFDPFTSYLERRRRIIEVWNMAKEYGTKVVSSLIEFGQSYLPEDLDALEEMFEL